MVTTISYGVSTDEQLYTPAPKSNWPDIAANLPSILIASVQVSNGLGA